MKKEYIKPESFVETINEEDIIATSIDGQNIEDGDDGIVGYGEFSKERQTVDFSDSESIW